MATYLIGIVDEPILGIGRQQEGLEQLFSVAGAEVFSQGQLLFLLGIIGNQHMHIECLEADVDIRGKLRMLLLHGNVSSKRTSLRIMERKT